MIHVSHLERRDHIMPHKHAKHNEPDVLDGAKNLHPVWGNEGTSFSADSIVA